MRARVFPFAGPAGLISSGYELCPLFFALFSLPLCFMLSKLRQTTAATAGGVGGVREHPAISKRMMKVRLGAAFNVAR
jgi:hypothetical protein